MGIRAVYLKKKEELALRYSRLRYSLLYHRILTAIYKSFIFSFLFYLTLFFTNQIANSAGKGSGALYFLAYLVLFFGSVLTLYHALPSRIIVWILESPICPQKTPYIMTKIKDFIFFLLPLILVFHLKVCFVEKLQIQGDSMKPAFVKGQKIWIEKLSSGIALPPLNFPFTWQLPAKVFPQGLRPLKRGDIVAFVYPNLETKKEPDAVFIKRVVALAKEKYRFHKGQIYINNTLLKEPYLPLGLKTPLRPAVDPLRTHPVSEKLERLGLFFSYAAQYGLPAAGQVPEGSLLVLGDERNISGDSRTFGFVPISYIIGKVIFQKN